MLSIVKDYNRVVWLLFSLYLASGTVMDIRSKSVPRWWLLAGGVLTAVLLVYPVPTIAYVSDTVENGVTVTMRAAGAGMGVLFLAVSWMKPHSFGAADSLLIVMTGALTGLIGAMDVLMIAFGLAALYGLLRYAAMRSKAAIAFIPFLTVGYIAGGMIRLWR